MRVLTAHSFYRIPGGEDRHVRDQVRLLSGRHEVRLFARSNADLGTSPTTALRMLYSKRIRDTVGRVLDDFGPDVAHVHNIYPSIGPGVHFASRDRGIPLLMTVHNQRLRCPNGFMFTEGTICRRCQSGWYHNAFTHSCFPRRTQAITYGNILWAHRFVMRLERFVARFIVPSKFMYQRLVEWGVPPNKLRLVRHFVAHPGPEPALTLGTTGLLVARLSPEKGLETLLRALKSAGDPPFTIAGDGPLRQRLERLKDDLGLRHTDFLGWRPHEEILGLMASARYVVAPSLSEETANLAALEALAAGRPLLVSEGGALPELVATGAGLRFPPGEELDLSSKIARLVADDEFCRGASVEAARISEWFTPERHLRDLEAVYRETLG